MDDGIEMNYDEHREKILSDFIKKLKEDPKTLIYDEDEWIEIADYALDTENNFILFEAVLWGLVAYPCSQGLRDREAILLSQFINLDEDEIAFKTLASRPKASRIAKMLNYEAKNQNITSSAFYKGLKRLLLNGEPLADHEVIEFIRILVDSDSLNYIENDLAKWEKSVVYPETLWYEIAANSIEFQSFELGVKVIEKLLELQPYNADYWVLKGKLIHYLQNSVEPPEEKYRLIANCIDALETALAIEPENKEAKQLYSLYAGSEMEFEEQAEVSLQDINKFNEAVESENRDVVKKLARQIPLLWFGTNINFMMYLCLKETSDERTEEILNYWVEFSLNHLNCSDVNALASPENSALVCIAEIFMVFDDIESFMDLYNRVKVAAKKLKCVNPLEFQYSLCCILKDDKRNFNLAYKRLENSGDQSRNINFNALTLIKDKWEKKRELENDSRYHFQRKMMLELEQTILLKGRYGWPATNPSLLYFLLSHSNLSQ